MNTWSKKWSWLFDERPTISIEENTINELYFPSKDVLFTQKEKARRGRELVLLNKSKFKEGESCLEIDFEDIEGPKSIVFSTWKITNTLIEGNKKLKIPIHRISNLKLSRSNTIPETNQYKKTFIAHGVYKGIDEDIYLFESEQGEYLKFKQCVKKVLKKFDLFSTKEVGNIFSITYTLSKEDEYEEFELEITSLKKGYK